MSRGPPPSTRYILRLWAAITIQEDTRKRMDKQTYPVDCRATSPTTQERDSLKSALIFLIIITYILQLVIYADW
jgi:hypothetical protein